MSEYALLFRFIQPSSPGIRSCCSVVRQQVLGSVTIWKKQESRGGREKLMEKEEGCKEA